MKRLLLYLMVAMMAAAGCTLFRSGVPGKDEPARPAKLDPASAEKISAEIIKERADTEEWLRSGNTSYLAAVDRIDFGQRKMLTVGRAEDNDLRLSADDIEPHHLRITVDGDRFRVEAVDPKARFKIDEKETREATVDPSRIQVGRFVLRLSHQHFPALIVFDPESPHFKQYKGLGYFPVDLSYRYVLPLKRYRNAEKVTIMSTRGHERTAERAGWVDFLVGDTPCRLEVSRLIEPGASEDDLSIFFRDATSGKETYPMGRYVDLKKLESGSYLLDFNLAYNPACAFSNYYNCPLPPKSNTLKVSIRAGEKDSHYH